MKLVIIALILAGCSNTGSSTKVEPQEWCWHDDHNNIVCGYDSLAHCNVVVEITGEGECKVK